MPKYFNLPKKTTSKGKLNKSRPTTTYKAKTTISEAQKERRAADAARRRAASQASALAAQAAKRQSALASQAQVQRDLFAEREKTSFVPTQVQAEVGQDWNQLAKVMDVEVGDLIKANPVDTEVKAGAVYNVPDMTRDQLAQQVKQAPITYDKPDFYDPDFNPNLPPRFYDPPFDTGETSAEGIVYPEGMNAELFAEFGTEMGTGKDYDVEGDYGARFWSPTIFGDVETYDELVKANPEYWDYVSESPRLSDVGTAWSMRNISEENKYSRNWEKGEMFELPGMSLDYRWEEDPLTGEMKEKPREAVFDALYEINGFDPQDPDDVELFWSVADDDLLFMGEFFEAIEWPTGGGYGGGYGGYGGGYGAMPTPYTQYLSGGQKPVRGDYASYLSLTSWSI